MLLYIFFGNGSPVKKKVYPGAVRIYFEMVHILTCPTVFFMAGVTKPLYSFRLALQC